MIGSAGRNVGKTEFACKLLSRLTPQTPIAGVKVTTVHDRHGPCPRGGDGCGVCSTLTGTHCLTIETGVPSDKDTSRLLRAGAHQVLWLRVRMESMLEGATDLFSSLRNDPTMICESNSLRLVTEPGLFVIVRHDGDHDFKPSASQVARYADAVVTSDGKLFDPSPDVFQLLNGRWTFRRQATALVLAGGRSRRMGTDKSLLPVQGLPLVERVVRQVRPHFDEVLVLSDSADKLEFLGERIIEDQNPGQGPLMALAGGLEASSHDLNLVVPCDVPDLPVDFVYAMLRQAATTTLEGVVPVTPEGHLEPLVAVYNKRFLRTAKVALAQGERTILNLLTPDRVEFVPVPPHVRLSNLNTSQDYARYCRTR